MSFDFEQEFITRFVRYAKISTGSDSSTGQHPSTRRQFDLAYMLKNELAELGISAEVSDSCYVYAVFNAGRPTRICLLAHLDTSEDAPNERVNPYVHSYRGTDICLQNGTILSAAELESEGCVTGDTLITSDGTTLLGGDDKAGIAVIMTLLYHLKAVDCSSLPEIAICFTPDEEIGEGVDNIDLRRLKTENTAFALTIDGANHHEIALETFSAKAFKITLEGVNTHPGDAYGKLVNAAAEACKLVQSILSEFRPPERSRGRENYVLVNDIAGDVAKCTVAGIIRSFDNEDIEMMRGKLIFLVQEFYRTSLVYLSVEVREQYRNLATYLTEDVKQRVTQCGKQFNATIVPIRGGTDGSRLSAMGLQTPNIWDGAFWFHSLREVVNVRESVDAVHYLLALMRDI